MRFYTHRTGDTREITKFAWLPIYVNGCWYWLERITIHQTYNGGYDIGWHNDYLVHKVDKNN